MDPISLALSEDIPLPISVLSDLGKGSLRKALADAVSGQTTTHLLRLWPKLVLTAGSPQVNDKHITAASNALCVYLAGGRLSTVTEIQQYVSSEGVWLEAFQCAHKAFNDGKTKPAFQIMETLCDLLQQLGEPRLVNEILKMASLPLVRIILLASPRSEVKKACLMLSCLHRRTPLYGLLDEMLLQCLQHHDYSWRQRLSEHNISIFDVSTHNKGSIAHLLLALILAMVDLDTRTAALKLCSVLCNSAVENTATGGLQSVVERVIQLYLERNHTAMGNYAECVLPVILDNKEKLISFIRPYAISCRDDTSRMALFIAILKVGRSKAILSESETLNTLNAAFPSPPTIGIHPEELSWCKQLLMTADPEVQILTYGLLASSPAGNAVIAPETLNCLTMTLKYLHEQADAHERGEILSITKRLLRRLHNSALALRKSSKAVNGDQGDEISLSSYKSFMKNLYDFLKDELKPGISYPRHILGLSSLQHLLGLTEEPELFLNDTGLVADLINLVLDPFEDVRSSASAMLHTLACEHNGVVQGALSRDLLERVEALALKTGRADHADAMGRLYALQGAYLSLSNEAPVPTKGDSLAEAIRRLERLTSEDHGVELRPGCTLPVHGLLLGISYQLRYIPRQDEEILVLGPAVLDICVNVWNQMRVQLCVDSPETAAELEDETNDEGPKDLLAYSWRALRDSSVLLQSLIAILEPSQELSQAIGDLCMNQLSLLRHRGAFSTVAQSFNSCCEKIRSTDKGNVSSLIQEWYHVAITQIDEQGYRLTRRSAGLPAMLTALLSPADPKLFSTAIIDLMTIAQRSVDHSSLHDTGETKLPQVHALNCLRDIMTNAKFADAVAPYQNSVMELAAMCLSSRIWAIRNCGLMLLRACINRLDPSARVSVLTSESNPNEKQRDDTPFTIATHLLREVKPLSAHESREASSTTEHTFAGLDLLAHLVLEGPMAATAKHLVLQQLADPTWAVRDHAALLLAIRILNGSPVSAMLTILEQGLDGSEHRVHGVLLCCRYLMKRAITVITEVELDMCIDALIRKMTDTNEELIHHSPYVYAAWLDLLNDAVFIKLDHEWSTDSGQTWSLTEKLRAIVELDCRHGPYLLQRILLHDTCHMLTPDKDRLNTSKEMTPLMKDFLGNVDALSFTLDILRQRDWHVSHRTLLTFLAAVIDQSFDQGPLPVYVLEQALICIDGCFQYLAEDSLSVPQLLLERLDFDLLQTPRELRNAGLVVRASLLGKMYPTRPHSDYSLQQVEQWLRVVEDAAGDNLDLPTRLSAAAAVSTFIGYLTRVGISKLPLRVGLRLHLFLYDLLNDDDEDVRAEAIQAARKLKLRNVEAMDNLGRCALAAREDLLCELERQFAATPELTEEALVNVLKLGQRASGVSQRAGLAELLGSSAASKLHNIARTKNDLFAEERQNLYVDDIREIDAWTELLRNTGYASLPSELSEGVARWTLDGLHQIVAMLSRDQEGGSNMNAGKRELLVFQMNDQGLLPESLYGHPLGVTYDHEILVVMLQVVSLAGIFLRWKGKEKPQDGLKQVKDLCSTRPVNFVLLGAIKRALSSE